MHDLPLVTTIATAFTAAWVLGLVTQRLGLSPIVGYLLAGVAIGPFTPGVAADVNIAAQLAEIGVILLMFGVGLHFHWKELLAVRSIAIPGAVVQSVLATLAAIVVFRALGLPTLGAAVLGMAMAVASTVVLMRVLMDADVLGSPQGHVAVGWLIVEDIFTVVILVLIPVLGDSLALPGKEPPDSSLGMSLGIALAKLLALVAIVMLGGSRVIPWLLLRIARLRSRELFTLTVLVLSIAIAAGSSYVFGASMALGAFLAGMVVAQSPASHQAAADALPMRDAFAVLFFVSVGMLLNPNVLIDAPWAVLAALGIILVVKPLAALSVVAVLGHSIRTGLTVALGLAQIGEFSFIVSNLAHKHALMEDREHHVLVAAAIISISLNPLLFKSLIPIENWLRARPRLWRVLNGRAERRVLDANRAAAAQVAELPTDGKRLAVVVGFGPVGRAVQRLLADAGLQTAVIDMNMDTVLELTAAGQIAVYGDASHEAILEQAGMSRASHLVLTLPHSADRLGVVTAARNLNGDARILVRAHYLREREDLEQAGATGAVFEEAEAAVALARLVFADTGAHRELVETKVRDLRLRLILENMSNIRDRAVKSTMVPWTRVRKVLTSTSRAEVLQQVAQGRFSRWPAIDAETSQVTGYLLSKDLLADPAGDGDWTSLIRPLHRVKPADSVESTLLKMQAEGATVCLVEDRGTPIGLVTLEDMLEQVVGRIEDEYRHEDEVSLRDAVAAGGVILELAGRTAEQAIVELSARIPRASLPPGAEVCQMALSREAEVSTDLGVGVAVPHARCPHLEQPLIVAGRSSEGIVFSAGENELVRLVFLLVTPAEQPELQLSMLAQLARIAGDDQVRRRIQEATSDVELIDVLSAAPR